MPRRPVIEGPDAFRHDIDTIYCSRAQSPQIEPVHMAPSPARPRRFVFLSSNSTPWGGSEELWAGAAIALAEQGHQVSALKGHVDDRPPRVRRLRALGCPVKDPSRPAWVPAALTRFATNVSPHSMLLLLLGSVGLSLATSRPDLVIISQAGSLDGQSMGSLCRRLKKPYVLISQKAGYPFWPIDRNLPALRAIYTDARACYFVSEHNLRLTEEQFGVALPHARVVRNPFLVPWARRHDWPSGDVMRLACVGRLWVTEKGQDLLIRVLAREKWRGRPLSVTIFGAGPHRAALEAMAAYHRVDRVSFAGFVDDIPAIWNDHQALILPSRCEGLPLVLVEAMLSGRVPIATDVAGIAEMLDDGTTGFLAAAPTEDGLDAALERAWQRRDEWQAIGAAAAERIRELVPEDPAKDLALMLLSEASRADRHLT
jgi:glycosyltransferase involved in cell wall biosynthesis